jgi:hypothetical protein
VATVMCCMFSVRGKGWVFGLNVMYIEVKERSKVRILAADGRPGVRSLDQEGNKRKYCN